MSGVGKLLAENLRAKVKALKKPGKTREAISACTLNSFDTILGENKQDAKLALLKDKKVYFVKFQKDVADEQGSKKAKKTIEEYRFVLGPSSWYDINKLETYKNTLKTGLSITETNVDNFCKFIEKYADLATHTEIWDNNDWQTIYGAEREPVKRIDVKTLDALPKEMSDHYYCRDCGYQSSRNVMTIDHQGAQNNGSFKPILRVLRAMGLTKNSGKELKKSLPTVAKKISKTRAAANVWAKLITGMDLKIIAKSDELRNERYSINDYGVIYVSLINAAQDIYGVTFPQIRKSQMIDSTRQDTIVPNWDAFSEACMNSFYNLRPLCGSCNSKLRDSNRLNPDPTSTATTSTTVGGTTTTTSGT